ncbi:hypothetical protein HA075_07605 [bacterium BFN5]|nr:hypothetical protein HA075_07420 [bacterium BFN5]QJW45730.1 hypothetical protein HA075_07605 [bacterium BFN5]
MNLSKTSKGLISLLCICVLILTATPVWAENVEIGSGAVAGKDSSGNDGSGSDGNVAVGNEAKAGIGESGNIGNVAIGSGAQAGIGNNQINNTAIGTNSTAIGTNTTAIGANAIASAENSVAVGAGSETGSRANTVSVGKTGAERQIINVADGTAPTDAVNVRQLDRVSSRIDKVGALAAALSGLAPLSYKADQPTQGSIATGMFSGENAVAAGVYHYTKEDVMLNAGFAICGSEKMGRMGLTVRFPKSKDKEITTVAPIAPVGPMAPAIPATPSTSNDPAIPKSPTETPKAVIETSNAVEAMTTTATADFDHSVNHDNEV